jgi:hypothetical protein
MICRPGSSGYPNRFSYARALASVPHDLREALRSRNAPAMRRCTPQGPGHGRHSFQEIRTIGVIFRVAAALPPNGLLAAFRIPKETCPFFHLVSFATIMLSQGFAGESHGVHNDKLAGRGGPTPSAASGSAADFTSRMGGTRTQPRSGVSRSTRGWRELNARRFLLIHQRHQGGLTEAEEAELAELQAMADKWLEPLDQQRLDALKPYEELARRLQHE